jgi:hypothetical protein
MNNILVEQPYTPAEAERGKFTVIDPTTLESLGYPTTGSKYGRYAMFTYTIGVDPSITSNSSLSGGLPNSTQEKQQTFSANTSTAFVFTPPAVLLEISNRSDGSVYLTYSPTTFANLTAKGLEITKGAFYSIDRTVASVTIGSVAGGSVIVFGHYKG